MKLEHLQKRPDGYRASNDDLVHAIDSLLQETYLPAEPGAAVIVVRDGQTILRKGYGMANLELGVPIEPDMVFRLGSITKQFTAVCILMLLEQGKLALDDPITKFLPNYPTRGYVITVEHLLTHTSGLRSYTDMPERIPLIRKDFTLQELIDFFKNQPMQFAPGTRWVYNNSGYVLLGAIIEKVTTQTYEQFMQQHIFQPLGMKRSYYDSPERIIPRRVAGYQGNPNGYSNAAYVSMTQPYAAGALASTVDDLALWDAALHADRLVKQETLQRAFALYRLADGSFTDYGYGWGISEYQGHRIVEHGGGIQGFVTHAVRMPDDRVFVAILSNNERKAALPEQLAFKIAALAIGKPYIMPAVIEVKPDLLASYAGMYQISQDVERIITCEGSQLYSQRTGGDRLELLPMSADEFAFKDSTYRLRFVRNAEGALTAVELRGRSRLVEVATKTDKPLPKPG
jgi:CubicO group peptidase (beta-lactamase class C family)